jgi:hypothetical protein
VSPIRFRNRCEQPVSFRQAASEYWEVLEPGEEVDYAWDEPRAPRELECHVMGVDVIPEAVWHINTDARVLPERPLAEGRWVLAVRADGLAQVRRCST